MDASAYRIREFRDADHEALAEVQRRAFPDLPRSAAEMRHFDRFSVEGGPSPVRLAAVLPPADELVGQGELDQPPHHFDPQKYWLSVVVDPAHRGRGLGRALFERLEAEARRRAATTLWVQLDAEDPEGVRFARARGFVELRRVRQSRVELAESRPDLLADRSPEHRALGVEFTTLAAEGAEREEVRREFFRLHEAAAVDVPSVGPRTPITYEQFARHVFSAPGFYPEATFLARVGRRYVSLTALERRDSQPWFLSVAFTGTDPAFRGRGLATELKRRSIEFARASGFTTVETWNDFENPRIWSINERVGFRSIHIWSTLEKALRVPPSS